MAKWRVYHSWPADVTPSSDRDAAFAFTLHAEGEEDRQTTVEYAAPSQLASMSHARNVLEQWLDEDAPPRRLLVDREGNARALLE